MDTTSKDKAPPETTVISNAENASFILGTGNLVTPQKHAAETTSNLCTPGAFKSPLNFSTVTVEQLGITPESFVKISSGKSASYLKKSRRRSTVGVRGSPETNHLIRFIAKQRNLKNAARSPLAHGSPFQGSPVLYHNVNSLKERISAFQSAFCSIKENRKMADCPEFPEAETEFTTTGLTKKEGLGECQQSGFPTNLSSKRRKISSQSNSDENLIDAKGEVIDLQLFSIDTDRTHAVETCADLSEKPSQLGLTQYGCSVEESIPISELTEASNGLRVADCVEDKGSSAPVPPDKFIAGVSSDVVLDLKSPAPPACRRDSPSTETFVLRSVLKKHTAKLFSEHLQEHCDNLCDDGTQPSSISNLANCCRERKVEDQENCKAPTFLNMRKRKRVTFGEDLSPEVFDESLPANTPLRKGGTPVCKKDLSSISPLLLEQSPVPEQLPQPNFDDKGENLENIEPLQVSFAVLSSPNKSPISETLSGTDTFSSSNNHEKISSCKVGRVTRTSNRRKQLISFAEESVCNLLNTEAQPCKEKKINRRKSQETKCTNRALPKKNQVLKRCRKKKGKGKKSVQKSLYGERDIASKKPLLSPIPELPEVSEMTPSVPSVRRLCSDDFNSNGKNEEVKLPKNPVKRKNLLPKNPEDLHTNQGFDTKYDVPEFCCSYIKSSSSLGNVTFDGDPNTSTVDVDENKNISKAENKLESENKPKSGTEAENSPISCTSGTGGHVVSDNPKPNFMLQWQEFSAANQTSENLCQIFKISEDIKCEKQDFLVAPEGKLQCNLMPDSQREFNCLEDVLLENIKESKSQSEDLGRKSSESSSFMNRRERKHRRRSMCCFDAQSLSLEENRNHKPSYSVGSSVETRETSLENPELYKDLSDAIEQTFQRANSETRVRRSTRLRKDSENEGLVWISLPFSPTSQKTKRRTICAFDSREFGSVLPRKERVSSGQHQCTVLSVPGTESSESSAVRSSDPPGERRESCCAWTLANAGTTAQSRRCRRTTLLFQKGGRSLTDLESIEPSGELNQ